MVITNVISQVLCTKMQETKFENILFQFTECLDTVPAWFDQNEDIHCYFIDTCTHIQCCLNSTSTLGRSFSIELDIRPCDFEIIIAIEEFSRKTSLVDFEWGKPNVISLFGLISLR
jgi:hypothetical protein